MRNLLLSLLLMLINPFALAEITVKRLNDVPEKIQYQGSPIDIREVTDVIGKHIVILSKIEEKAMGERGYRSEIYAYKYTFAEGEYRKKWEVKEFNSTILVSVNFVDQLQIVDIDKDGVAETIFMYEVAPDGLDPVTVKLMLHYKDNKYAIRGEIPQQDSNEYRKKSDLSFDHLPKSVKNYAFQYWERAVKNSLESNK